MTLKNSKRLVIKIGSSLLLDDQGQLNRPWLLSLVCDIGQLAERGIKVVLVTSGSVACGCLSLGLDRSHLKLDMQQAAAATGQIQLIHTYQTLMEQQGLKAAQILLTIDDMETRRRYINLRNTIESLLNVGVIPIINENDSVATAELRYGDNDRLAARVAHMVEADTLILLSDVAGLYDKNPNLHQDAKLIPVINEITPDIEDMAGESSSHYGTGGMKTKIAAAKICANYGARTFIMPGTHRNPITNFEKTGQASCFLAKKNLLGSKKLWLKDHLNPQGVLIIDQGAEQALTQGKSLLPVGINQLEGRFNKGDLVLIVNQARTEIARGLSNYSDRELDKIIQQPTDKIKALLGYNGMHEVIHRNNLVLMS